MRADRLQNGRGIVPLLLLALTTAWAIAAPAAADADYESDRQQALELFAQGKRLGALPILEQLAKANPMDDGVLVALAASLVEHAGTLPDVEAGGRERLRARELLERARELGNTSSLAANLLQLLRGLPASGAIKFSDDPRVESTMRAGEAAFARRDYAEALTSYQKALELEPTNYAAVLFIANTYDRKGDFGNGAEWYQRAIQLSPDVETAYRYYADMLAKQGAMERARTMLIQAAVAEPYNRVVWRELHAWAAINKTRINAVFIGIPAQQADRRAVTVWRAYGEVRTKWQQGGEFTRRFPGEETYRHSLPEEYEALSAAARALETPGEAGEKNDAELIAGNPDLRLLLDLHGARLIEPYVLFSLGDSGISRDYGAYRARSRDRLEEYLNRFVVPAVHEKEVRHE